MAYNNRRRMSTRRRAKSSPRRARTSQINNLRRPRGQQSRIGRQSRPIQPTNSRNLGTNGLVYNSTSGGIINGPLQEFGRSKVLKMTIAKSIGLPYNINRVYNNIMSQTNNTLWNPNYLKKLLKMANFWIGSGVHTLEKFIMETRGGLDENDQPFDWWMCSGSCNTIGMGQCGSWCIGASCDPDLSLDTQGNVHQGEEWEYNLTLSYNF